MLTGIHTRLPTYTHYSHTYIHAWEHIGILVIHAHAHLHTCIQACENMSSSNSATYSFSSYLRFVGMCTCVNTCVCICIYIHAHLHTHTLNVGMLVGTHRCMFVCTYLYTFRYAYMAHRVYMHSRSHIMDEGIFTHECVHARMFICNLCILQGVYIGGHVCICSSIYVQVHTTIYVCMHPSKKMTMYYMYACICMHNVCMFYTVLTHYIPTCMHTDNKCSHANLDTFKYCKHT